MTIRELISELKELPQDLPVVSNYKEITDIEYHDSYYVINNFSRGEYLIGPAVVLE